MVSYHGVLSDMPGMFSLSRTSACDKIEALCLF